MSLKKLGMFTSFDFEKFSYGKRFLLISLSEWKNFDSGALLGTKAEAVILQDKTDYGQSGDANHVTNLYEKLIFKVPQKLNIPLSTEIKPINPKATIFGEFRNQLSIVCDNIEVVNNQK